MERAIQNLEERKAAYCENKYQSMVKKAQKHKKDPSKV